MLFVRHEAGCKYYCGPEIEIDSIIDRLGTGDAFTAGVLHGLAAFEENYQKIVDFAVILSALKHSVQGDFSNITETEVLHALQTGTGGAIRR